ncbi:TPA: hypothetical protein ACOEF8_002024 [Enterobacter roggenkampii]
MAESILLAILYGIILNVPAAVVGVAVNFLFFPKVRPPAGLVIIASLVFFLLAFPIVMELLGNKLGIYSASIATIISVFSFHRTVDI